MTTEGRGGGASLRILQCALDIYYYNPRCEGFHVESNCELLSTFTILLLLILK